MEEEFRWIKGFEGKYKVSNLGRFLMVEQTDSMGRKLPQKIKSTHKGVGGYSVVMLRKDGKKKMYLAHRLVAEAFIPNPYNKKYIDHIDGSRNNNNVNNLRWVTAKENSNNPITYRRLLIATLKNPTSGARNPYSRRISQYTLDGEYIATFDSVGLASKNTHICYTCINLCARGKRKTAGGYIWVYESFPKKLINNGKKIQVGYNGNAIIQFSTSGEVINEYVSIKDAAKRNCLDAASISRALRGKYKSCGGYIWKFKEQK